MDSMNIFKISRNSNFQFHGNSNNNLHNNGVRLLSDLTESLNRNLTESVFDFMNCFICLSRTKEPLSCPKCNNFACKKCLEKYFDGQIKKKCPICKQEITYSELKENKIVKEIEKILNNEEPKKNKIELLQKLIIEKKNLWEDQTNHIKNIIEKIFKYQEVLQEYKKEYDFFLLNCKIVLEKTFKDYFHMIEELINTLLSYNRVNKISEIQCNDYENNIKDLIKELLIMDRKHFNKEKKDETDIFINTSMKIIPSLNNFKIREVKIKKEDFNQYSSTVTKGSHYKIGDYQLKYNFNTKKGFKSFCELNFTLKNNINCCFLFIQNIVDKNNRETLFPMKLTKKNEKKYTYECIISIDEFDNGKEEEIRMETEALIFSI